MEVKIRRQPERNLSLYAAMWSQEKTQRLVVERVREQGIALTESDFSLICRGRLIPTQAQMVAIAKVLAKEPWALFAAEWCEEAAQCAES